MKRFIKKIAKVLFLGVILATTSLGCVRAVGDVIYIGGMYRSGLDPERYSVVWVRREVNGGIVTTGMFRGHSVSVFINLDGQVVLSTDDADITKLVHDSINDRNSEKYNLSEDERAYLAISLCLAVKY